MGKEQSGVAESIRGYTPDSVILCTTPGKQKDTGMRTSILQEYGQIPVAAASPHDVPEDLYNDALNRDPGAIAAAKVLQVAQYYPGIADGLFSQEEQAPHHDVVLVANDVVLELPHQNGGITWNPVNKPKQGDGEDTIRQALRSLLMPENGAKNGYVEARFRCGGASFAPKEQRGIFGILEIPFWFAPFSEKEIDTYVEKYHGDLHSTNGSCRWNDPEIFDPHMLMIANVMKEDPDFQKAKLFFHRALFGALPGMGTLLDQTSIFVPMKTQGYNTGLMNDINERFLHYDHIGAWGTWRTYGITYANTP